MIRNQAVAYHGSALAPELATPVGRPSLGAKLTLPLASSARAPQGLGGTVTGRLGATNDLTMKLALVGAVPHARVTAWRESRKGSVCRSGIGRSARL